MTRTVRVQNANVCFDVARAKKNIAAFNKSAAYLAGDWLMHEFFGHLRDGRKNQPASVCAVLVNALWKTQVDREKGAAMKSPSEKPLTRVCCHLEQCIGDLRGLARRLGTNALVNYPDNVEDGACEALRLIFEVPNVQRKNYSFTTKFLHWLSPTNFPIVDSRARNNINELLRSHRRDCRRAYIPSGGCGTVEEDYKRWIWFYHYLLTAGMEQGWGEKLVEHDFISQSGDPIKAIRNTLLRVLDKHFWMAGSA